MLRVFLLSFFSIFTVFVSGQATRIFDQRDYGFGELSSNLSQVLRRTRTDIFG